jgi:Uri superfamily endonuclease
VQRKKVGSLGRIAFEPGFCVYVGSGGVNVLKRVRRHMKADKALRWHIDYLTTGPRRMRFVDAWLLPGEKECDIARRIGKELQPVSGFGASDCRCPGHLFHARDIGQLGQTLALVVPRAPAGSSW